LATGESAPSRGFSFQRLSAATFLAYTSYGVQLAVLPFAELNEGGGPLLATLVLGAPLLSQTLASFGWGWLSDRLGRRRELLAVGLALQAPLFLAEPFLGPLGLFGARILQSAFFGAVVLTTTLATEEPAVSSAKRLGQLQFALNGGMLLGIAVTFPLLRGAGVSLSSSSGWALAGVLAAFALAAGTVGAFAGEVPRSSSADNPPRRPLTIAPLIIGLAIVTASVATFRYIAVAAIPIQLATSLGRHGFFGWPANAAEQLALWVVVSSAANLAVAPLSGRLSDSQKSRRWTLGISAAVYVGLWTSLAVFPVYAVVFVVWSFPTAVFFTVAGIREASALDIRENRGKTVGLLTAAFNSGGLFGAGIAGVALSGGLGFSEVYSIAAVGSLISVCAVAAVIYRLPP
jgi:MFS family permease